MKLSTNSGYRCHVATILSDDTYNKTSHRAIGLYTDYEGDQAMPYRSMCCTEVSKNKKY